MNLNQNQSYCVGGRHKSSTIDIIEFVKVNPKSNKIVKVSNGKCDICGQSRSQIFTK